MKSSKLAIGHALITKEIADDLRDLLRACIRALDDQYSFMRSRPFYSVDSLDEHYHETQGFRLAYRRVCEYFEDRGF